MAKGRKAVQLVDAGGAVRMLAGHSVDGIYYECDSLVVFPETQRKVLVGLGVADPAYEAVKYAAEALGKTPVHHAPDKE